MIGKIIYILNRDYMKVFPVMIVGTEQYDYSLCFTTELLIENPTETEQAYFNRSLKRIRQEFVIDYSTTYQTCPKEANKVVAGWIRSELRAAHALRDKYVYRAKRLKTVDTISVAGRDGMKELQAAAIVEHECNTAHEEAIKMLTKGRIDEQRKLRREAEENRRQERRAESARRAAAGLELEVVAATRRPDFPAATPGHYLWDDRDGVAVSVREYTTVGGETIRVEELEPVPVNENDHDTVSPF